MMTRKCFFGCLVVVTVVGQGVAACYRRCNDEPAICPRGAMNPTGYFATTSSANKGFGCCPVPDETVDAWRGACGTACPNDRAPSEGNSIAVAMTIDPVAGYTCKKLKSGDVCP